MMGRGLSDRLGDAYNKGRSDGQPPDLLSEEAQRPRGGDGLLSPVLSQTGRRAGRPPNGPLKTRASSDKVFLRHSQKHYNRDKPPRTYTRHADRRLALVPRRLELEGAHLRVDSA